MHRRKKDKAVGLSGYKLTLNHVPSLVFLKV